MRRLYAAVLFSSLISTGWAQEQMPPPLNKVLMEFKAEQWVSTKTALVTIGINATLADKAFEKIHGEILNKLKQLSSQADWHITGFNRTVDKSGLEQLQAQAVARLAEADIAALRNQVKTISKPGETYTVDDIQYSPSDTEIRDANIALRENIYQQINAELTRLNKNFPDQKYFLNEANFMMTSMPVPMAAVAYNKMSAERAAPALTVSDKVQMSANVVLASEAVVKPKA